MNSFENDFTGDAATDAATLASREPDRSMLAPRYTLDAPALGNGSSGHVYRAFDNRERTWVAVKLLKPGRSLAREVCPDRPKHPNVCPLLDYGAVEGRAYLVMPLALHSLEHELQTGPYDRDWKHALADVIQIVDGLSALHHSGIVHRDLKPANILRINERHLVISDFGTASRPDLEMSEPRFAGTPGYLAPECVLGADVSCASDVWSLGVVLYFYCFGSMPAWVAPWGTPRLARASKTLSALDLDLERLCAKCMAYEPDQRPAHAGAVRKQLQRILDKYQLEVAPPRSDLAAMAVVPVSLRERALIALASGVLLFLILWALGSILPASDKTSSGVNATAARTVMISALKSLR